MAEVGVTAFAAAITFGNTRYRAGAEVAIVLFAAGAVEWVLRAASARRSSSAPTVASSDPAADGRDGTDDRDDQVLRST
jgi:hypothetical protein